MTSRRTANRVWNLRVNILAASPLIHGHVRERLLRSGGVNPNGTSIRPGVYFASDLVTFGSGGLVERHVTFENREHVSIGSRVYIGPECYIGTSSHEVAGPQQRAGAYKGAGVKIEDGCWIGARAVVLPGITISRGCVIAAGSVVTRTTEPNGLYAGVPATRKKDL
ncbi:acetyltransferase [Microbacterium sp. Gd 4-13]|nr:acetyltransferase [Microbacterium sp. Gd 4-13]